MVDITSIGLPLNHSFFHKNKIIIKKWVINMRKVRSKRFPHLYQSRGVINNAL